MTKTKQIWTIALMFLLFLPLAFAEIKISGNTFLDIEDNIWTQHVTVEYPDIEAQPQTSLGMRAKLSCEDLSVFNSNNSAHQIRNASLRTFYHQQNNVFNFFINYTDIERDYGCSDNSPSCDITNTPPSILSDNFLCTFFGIHCTITQIGTIEIPFTLRKGENINLNLVTYFNSTDGAVADSFCRFGLTFDSRNCEGCSGKSFEEVTNAIETQAENFATKTTVFSFINSLVDLNFQIWAIISYIVKIGVLIGAVFGLFYLIFWIYNFVKNEFGTKR